MRLSYEGVVDFLASAPSPERILKYKVPPKVQARVSELIERKKKSQLTAEETDELESFLNIEHILRMAKAKAALRLQKGK
jgi:hypothetical protein